MQGVSLLMAHHHYAIMPIVNKLEDRLTYHLTTSPPPLPKY